MKERIVIVEDDESIRRLVEVALQGNGFQTRGFDNASDALRDMKADPPDVVIMDIMMQGIDGLEAVRLMRQERRLKEIPVIMLTAKDTEADKIVGLDAGGGRLCHKALQRSGTVRACTGAGPPPAPRRRGNAASRV